MAGSNQGKKSRRDTYRGKSKVRQGRNVRDDRCEESTSQKGSLNDISWYTRNPNLLVAAGSFPFPFRPGMDLPVLDDPQVTISGLTYNWVRNTIPGVFRLKWVPSFGNSNTTVDPASIAGKEFYTKVRAAYSGSLEADAPDFIVYVGALDSIFLYIAWLKRVYRTISTFSSDNYLMPDALMQAYGFSSTQITYLRANKTRFWQGINELVLQSRKFKCPAVMDLFNRHYWMSDNVYTDAPTARAQQYVFNPAAVYKIATVKEQSTGEDVTGLQMTLISFAGTDTVQGLIDFGMGLIQAMDAWDDCYTISGYLKRAFDGIPDFFVEEIGQGELLEAKYEPEVLTQIENSRAVMPNGVLGYSPSGVLVTQNVLTNAVISNVNFTVNGGTVDEAKALLQWAPNGINPMINMHVDVPTVADSVIATRLQASVKYTLTSTTAIKVEVDAGTEIVLEYSIFYKDANTDTIVEARMSSVEFRGVPTGASTTITTSSKAPDLLDQFDMHPITFAIADSTETGGHDISALPIGDIYNPTIISRRDLENLHRVCFYSELNSFGI